MDFVLKVMGFGGYRDLTGTGTSGRRLQTDPAGVTPVVFCCFSSDSRLILVVLTQRRCRGL